MSYETATTTAIELSRESYYIALVTEKNGEHNVVGLYPTCNENTSVTEITGDVVGAYCCGEWVIY